MQEMKTRIRSLLRELENRGSEQTKKVLSRHGAREPFFGVKIEELKKLRKKIKKDYELSLALFDTGNSDAMYLAGLISDPARMTKKDLNAWVREAYWYLLSEYTVAWTAAESRYGRELALKWIESKQENVAAAGWATLASLVAVRPDTELDLTELKRLIARATREIHRSPDRVRYTMNGFIIAIGTYVSPLLATAREAARKIGTVTVDMGGTACKVPPADRYIDKVRKMGRTGRKRKTAFC